MASTDNLNMGTSSGTLDASAHGGSGAGACADPRTSSSSSAGAVADAAAHQSDYPGGWRTSRSESGQGGRGSTSGARK
jgi:hypothetical protein